MPPASGGLAPTAQPATLRVLVTPSGDIAFSHQKGRTVPGWETELSNPEDGRLPVVTTTYGRLAAAICYWIVNFAIGGF